TEVDGGIYTPAWNDATYDACLRRAREHIEQGRRVIVDASFREDARREVFVRAGERLGVPVRILHFTAPPAVVRERLARRVDDASDADWDVYVHAASVWEPFGPITRPRRDEVSTVGSVPSVLKNVREVLARHGLAPAHVERSVAWRKGAPPTRGLAVRRSALAEQRRTHRLPTAGRPAATLARVP